MQAKHRIAAFQISGNVIVVTPIAVDDGDLTIYDLSYGPAQTFSTAKAVTWRSS
jgi:hypothetical protein